MRNISIFILSLGLFISCNSERMNKLELENGKLKRIISDHLMIKNDFYLSEHLMPVTLTKQEDYFVGDTITLRGALAITNIDNLSFSVSLTEGDSIRMIDVDSNLVWEYSYISKREGLDTLAGNYFLNVNGVMHELMFKHILNIHSNK